MLARCAVRASKSCVFANPISSSYLISRFVLLSLLGGALCARPQPAPPALDALPDAPQPQNETAGDLTIRAVPIHVLHDQGVIWTSPLHVHGGDWKVVVPLVLVTGAAIATDKRTLHDVVSLDPAFNNDNTNASNVMI